MDCLLAREDDGVRILVLVGAFDTAEVDAFQAKIDQVLDDMATGGKPLVMLDMLQITFINATALGLLLRSQKRLQAVGGKMVIAKATSFLNSMFRTLGTDRAIEMFETEESALAELRKPVPAPAAAAPVDRRSARQRRFQQGGGW